MLATLSMPEKDKQYNRLEARKSKTSIKGLHFCVFSIAKQDQGSQVAPQGCKISPCNSTELNFGFFNEIALVETINYNLIWSYNGPDMAPIWS